MSKCTCGRTFRPPYCDSSHWLSDEEYATLKEKVSKLYENKMITSRTDFNDTWLIEMPQNIGSFSMFDMLDYNIRDRIKYGSKIIDLENGLRKIVGQQIVYYWYERNNTIVLGAELSIKPQGLVVTGVAKNPTHHGSPYASDLYAAILNDSNRAIRVVSDIDVSEEAFKVWARLLQMGHKISVYDNREPGKTFRTIDSVDELRYFYKADDTEYRRYQFVLSENNEGLAETRSYFNTRRMRELTGANLSD